jgi:U3 small nucleolar RNA-associated protein 7
MTQNPHNAIINLGHSNGTVTLWSPNMSTPLVRMFTHHGPVRALAVDREGRHMVSAGADHRVRIWDIRNYREIHSYYTQKPTDVLALSELGLLGVGWGGHVMVWKDALRKKQQSPYMVHDVPGETVSSLRFCPFDDILGTGHSAGFTSLIVPGAGEPNFDARESNPYQTAKQRQQTEVRGLLDKLQPEMISLDPEFVGNIDLRPKDQRKQNLNEAFGEGRAEGTVKEKNRAKGKNSAMKRYLRRKTKNVIDERTVRMEAIRKKEKQAKEGREESKLPPVLSRFERRGD